MSQRKTDAEFKSRYRGKKVKGKRIDEQRFIMEQILGRKLERYEIVHHKDGNKLNNTPDNLVVMTLKEHTRLHMAGIAKSEESKRKEAATMHQHWQEGMFDDLKRRVIATDSNTGEVRAIYGSIREAAAQGYNRRHITSCCNGKRLRHKGLCWHFE